MAPLLIFALLKLASMAVNNRGQKDVNAERRKREGEAKAVRDRNYATAEAARQRSVASVESTVPDQKIAALDRTEAYQSVQEPIATRADLVSPENRGSSQIVDEGARRTGEARAYTNNLAMQRGGLDSLADVFMKQGITQQHAGADINTAGRATANWMNGVLPAQLGAANRAGDSWKTIGDLFQMASSIYGAKGLGKAGGGAPTRVASPYGTGGA